MKLYMPNQLISSQDLANVVAALATAVNLGFMTRQHAEGVWKHTLDFSGYNTEKPAKKQGQFVETTTETITEKIEVVTPKVK